MLRNESQEFSEGDQFFRDCRAAGPPGNPNVGLKKGLDCANLGTPVEQIDSPVFASKLRDP